MSYFRAVEHLGACIAHLANVTTIDELANGLLDAITEFVPATHTGFFFFEPRTGELRLVNARGYSEQERHEAQRTAVHRHPMKVIRTGQMLHVPDTFADPLNQSQSAATSVTIRARLFLPVCTDGGCVGTLGLADTKPNAFSNEAVKILGLAASLAGVIYGRLQAFEESRRKEEQLRSVLEGARLGSWDWEIVTGQVSFNPRWAEMLGYEPGELAPDVSTWEKLLHPDDVPHVMSTLQAHLDGETEAYATEHRLKTKAGTWKWVLDAGRVIRRDAHGRPLRAAGIHHDIDDRKEAERLRLEMRKTLERLVAERTAVLNETVDVLRKEVTEREQAERTLFEYQQRLARATESLVVAEEEERRRLAEQLHDGIGQELTLLRLQLDKVHFGMPPECGAKPLFGELDDAVKNIMRLTRGLTMDLSPIALQKFGLWVAIEGLLERTGSRQGLEVATQWRTRHELSQLHGTIVYGAVREIIHNAVKHANARTLAVSSWRRRGVIWVRVRDDGVGFPPDFALDGPTQSGACLGLFAWRERLVGVGGKLHIRSGPRRGGVVDIEIAVAPGDAQSVEEGK